MKAWLIRTVVPICAGFLVTWLVSAGLNIDNGTVEAALIPAFTFGYATAAHAIETKWPSVGKWLMALGIIDKQPEYKPPAP